MATSQTAIPCTLMRGGTSRGAFFLARDLPGDESLRERVLLSVMGGPDDLQIDGIGGGHPLSNKVAVVSKSLRTDADVDYLFLQVNAGRGQVSALQNCGNMLAGVGPFAITHGLVPAKEDETVVRVYMVNSGKRCEVRVPTPGSAVETQGNVAIDGVPGSSAPIVCDYFDLAGSTCGALLPTGSVRDRFCGVDTSCVDNGMPVVTMRASDLGISGYELPAELDQDHALKAQLERIRLEAGRAMNLGDVSNKTVPKLALLAAPRDSGVVSARMFIPSACHKTIGVLAAVTVAVACILPGSVAADVAQRADDDETVMAIEHAAGSMQVRLRTRHSSDGLEVTRAGVIRTARALFEGRVFVPVSIWDGVHPVLSPAEGGNNA